MIPTTINPARRIPMLATALAAGALTGCMFSHSGAQAPHILTPEEQAAKNISDFVDSANAAIDQSDPAQLKPTAATRRMPPMGDDSLLSTATTKPAAVVAENTAANAAVAVPTTAPATQPKPVVVVPVVAPEPTVDQAMAVLRKQASAHPALTTTLALALLDGAQGRAPNLQSAASLSAPDQKIFTDVLAALEGMTTPISASTTLADRASPLVDAAEKWQTTADLSLPKVTLASRVDSFGVYTPLDPKFPQGVSTTVILYCEVAHFDSHRTDDGHYETDLSQQDTLLTADGLLLWRPTTEDITDRSLNQRHDFYLVKKITLPDTLAAGKYTLRLSVTDRTANRLATATLPIEITAN